MVHRGSLVMMVARIMIASTLAHARRVTEFCIESRSDDTPTAKHTVASLLTGTIGESYGGHCEACEDVDEEELNAHCTKCNRLLRSSQGDVKLITVPLLQYGMT